MLRHQLQMLLISYRYLAQKHYVPSCRKFRKSRFQLLFGPLVFNSVFTESICRCLDEWDVFLDAVNRKAISQELLKFSLRNRNSQFIFISPQVPLLASCLSGREQGCARTLGQICYQTVGLVLSNDVPDQALNWSFFTVEKLRVYVLSLALIYSMVQLTDSLQGEPPLPPHIDVQA